MRFFRDFAASINRLQDNIRLQADAPLIGCFLALSPSLPSLDCRRKLGRPQSAEPGARLDLLRCQRVLLSTVCIEAAGLELANQRGKPFCFLGQTLCGRSRLLDHGCILLRHLVHLIAGG